MYLVGSAVYLGSSLRLRIIFELTRIGYSCELGVGGLEKSSKNYSDNCMDESDRIELGEKTREKFAALSDTVSGSSERRDANSNPYVT